MVSTAAEGSLYPRVPPATLARRLCPDFLEKFPPLIPPDGVNDLERSHAEVRAALIIAGKRIRKLSFGKRDDPVLTLLRRVLREARRMNRGGSPARLPMKT